MKGVVKEIGGLKYWLRKTYTPKNGLGWHTTITDKDGIKGRGFSRKNTMKSARLALKDYRQVKTKSNEIVITKGKQKKRFSLSNLFKYLISLFN